MSQNPPAHVLEALETLERASEPGDLGPAYQVLLDWRRQHQTSSLSLSPAQRPPSRIMAMFSWVIVVLSALALMRWVAPGLSEFWQGAITGVIFVTTIQFISAQFQPQTLSTPPPSIEERIDDAIGRWRHLVPAMRELPK